MENSMGIPHNTNQNYYMIQKSYYGYLAKENKIDTCVLIFNATQFTNTEKIAQGVNEHTRNKDMTYAYKHTYTHAGNIIYP